MILPFDPNHYDTVVERHVCDYHKQYPNENYPGCTCSSTMSSVRKPLAEINKYERNKNKGRSAWECPRCHKINAPHVDRCDCLASVNIPSVRTTTVDNPIFTVACNNGDAWNVYEPGTKEWSDIVFRVGAVSGAHE